MNASYRLNTCVVDELLSAGDVEVQAAVVGSYPKVLLLVLNDTRYILVDNCLHTLQQLANYHRRQLGTHIIGMIGVDGALYKSMEFTGPGVASLTMDDRLCICNMAIEAGAKNGIFPVDDVTRSYLKGRSQREPVFFEADPDAEYEKTIEIDLDKLEPTVSYPHLPENTHLASEGKDIKIDQVVIGSCTNGRLEDMEAAYNVLKGKHIAKGVRGIIIPATMAVYKECILRGWTTAFIDAGCIVSTPTCGPCLGGYMGILAEGERCVSTTNRNFVGRMGHVKSEVYLASPATAAASALTGCITDPRTV